MQHVLGMWAQLVAARREAEQQQCELATAQVSSSLHSPVCASSLQLSAQIWCGPCALGARLFVHDHLGRGDVSGSDT